MVVPLSLIISPHFRLYQMRLECAFPSHVHTSFSSLSSSSDSSDENDSEANEYSASIEESSDSLSFGIDCIFLTISVKEFLATAVEILATSASKEVCLISASTAAVSILG